jgi:hypothetical protein
LNVGSGGGAAAAPAAGGAPTGGAAAAEEPAAKEEEKKEEGRILSQLSWTLLTLYQKRKNQTRTWASVYSTSTPSSFLPSVPISAITLHIRGALR